MEDTNNDRFHSLEKDTIKDGHDNASNVPLQPTIDKGISLFYPEEIKQDDMDVSNTVNKGETYVCDSLVLKQTHESDLQNKALDMAYYDDTVVCDVKCEPQETSPHNTYHEYNSVYDGKYEPQETTPDIKYYDYNSVNCELQETSTDNVHHDDNSFRNLKSGTWEEQDQPCLCDKTTNPHVYNEMPKDDGYVCPVYCVHNVNSTFTGLQQNTGELPLY